MILACDYSMLQLMEEKWCDTSDNKSRQSKTQKAECGLLTLFVCVLKCVHQGYTGAVGSVDETGSSPVGI